MVALWGCSWLSLHHEIQMNQESKIFFFKYWFQKKIRHIVWSSLFKQSKIWIWDSANTEFRRNTRVLCEFIHFLPLLLLLRMPMSVAQVILDMVKLWQRYLVFVDGSSSFMPWAWASLASVPAVGKLSTEPNAAWENQTGFWGVAQLFHSGSGPAGPRLGTVGFGTIFLLSRF